MNQVDKKFIFDLLNSSSSTMVGELCKQNEIIDADKSITTTQKMTIVKALHKEKVYECFRDIKNQVDSYLKGRNNNNKNIYKPTK